MALHARSDLMVVTTLAAIVLFVNGLSARPASQECLHGTNSTVEQNARKKTALQAARQINTLQANGSVARNGQYLTRVELADAYAELLKKRPSSTPLNFDRMGEIIPGWQLTFDKTEGGYWFMIKDKTDPCGFAYVSNENGVIFTAEPIR